MKILLFVEEMQISGYLADILGIISLGAILCGVFVIVNKNPVVSVLFLIGLFGSIAGYLIFIGLSFMGLVYLVVYIGAISILFLFILMLINIRISELQINTINIIPLAITIGIALSYSLYNFLPYDLVNYSEYLYIDTRLNEKFQSLAKFFLENLVDAFYNILYYVSSNGWDVNLTEAGHITSIGSVMYTNYNMWLLIASFILLLAMVGCIVITLKQPNSTVISTNNS